MPFPEKLRKDEYCVVLLVSWLDAQLCGGENNPRTLEECKQVAKQMNEEFQGEGKTYSVCEWPLATSVNYLYEGEAPLKPFRELINWYRDVYTKQMVEGSNIPRLRMAQNLAVIQDAVRAFEQFKK